VKFWQDEPTFWNDNASVVLQKTIKEVNLLERYFLTTLDYDLCLDRERVELWYRKILTNTANNENSIPAGGLSSSVGSNQPQPPTKLGAVLVAESPVLQSRSKCKKRTLVGSPTAIAPVAKKVK